MTKYHDQGVTDATCQSSITEPPMIRIKDEFQGCVLNLIGKRTGCFFKLVPPLKILSTKKLI